MLCVITPEDKEVLHGELFRLAPPDLQPSRCCLPLVTLGVEQVVNLLVVDLQE